MAFRNRQSIVWASIVFLLVILASLKLGSAWFKIKPHPETRLTKNSKLIHAALTVTPRQKTKLINNFQKGMSYAGYNAKVFLTAASDTELAHMAKTNIKWISLIPIWYQNDKQATEINPKAQDSPSDASVIHAIQTTHRLGLKVNLKPFVDTPNNDWRAFYQPSNWSAWFKSYNRFILHYATLAKQTGAEEITIGTEYTSSDGVRPANWIQIIKNIRKIYTGKLTYAADYEDAHLNGKTLNGGYQNVGFWNYLDYVGIDAYYPLTKKVDPSIAELKAGWQPWIKEIENWLSTAKIRKKIIFTEIGFGSYPGNNINPGDWQGQKTVDLKEQANSYEATFEALSNKPWLEGIFWWSWDNPSTIDKGGGPNNWFFTPKDKPAETIIKNWYQKIN